MGRQEGADCNGWDWWRGSGSKGGDNNEERLRKMVGDHLRASELFAIDTRTPEGLASLTATLGQAL